MFLKFPQKLQLENVEIILVIFSVSKPNPLDQFFDSSNFEIFDSLSKPGNKEEGNLGGNRVFEIEIIGPYQLVSCHHSFLDVPQ